MDIKLLHQLFLGCNAVSTDTRKVTKNNLFFALSGDKFNGNTFAEDALQKGAKYAVVDDEKYDTSKRTILVTSSLKTIQELATYHRNYLGLKIIALTGSNGKTTTKELINVTLSKNYNTTATLGNLNNHIGVPLTLLSMTKDTEIGIVEMGANHQKEIEFLCAIAQPDYGYITNFGKAHLEGFEGIEGVIKGKSELYNYLLNNNKYVFLNADDTIQKEKLGTYIKKFGFSQIDTNYFKIEFIEASPFVTFKVEDQIIKSNLIGEYNFANLCAATIIAKYFNVEIKAIKTAIETYVPTNNRSQIIEKGTNNIILDAYNANPSSMEVALKNFSKQKAAHKTAILGDMFELGESANSEHQAIAELAISLNIDKIVLVGEHFFKVKIDSEKVKLFNSFKTFKANFTSIKNNSILIKGSRGMALERTLELL